MKKIISAIFAMFLSAQCIAGDSPVVKRVSIFSTSTDWQAVTGLNLNQYTATFRPDSRLIGRQGLILYYLDAFPCYGLAYGVRVWLGPNGKNDGALQIACVAAPTEIHFAYRNATRDADQATTTGILTCPVAGRTRELTIDLSRCTVGPDWPEYK